MRPKKLFQYYGGKYHLIEDIIHAIAPVSNDIVTFVDVFGGSGTVLLNMPLEWRINRVFNDLDSRVYRTIKQLKEEPQIIKDEMDKTLRSREYYNELKLKSEDEITPFEYLYLIANSFNGDTKTFGISINQIKNKYPRVIEQALKNAKYLRNWTLEHLDFREVIRRYDSESTFFYLDPPYLKYGKGYLHSFNEQDFRDLYALCYTMQGKWLMNESEVDFDFIKSLWGEPKFVKEYINYITNESIKSKRLEGFWTNY